MSDAKTVDTRPVKRDEVSKLRWTWEEMKNNKTAYFSLIDKKLLIFKKDKTKEIETC